MKKNTHKSNILLIGIIISFILLLTLIFLYSNLYNMKNTEPDFNKNDIVEDTKDFINEEHKTPKSVLESYGAVLVSRKQDKFEVIFPKGLFTENGESNEDFFNKLIDDMIGVLKEQSFEMTDYEKKIVIEVKYNTINKDYLIKINGKENFFEETNGIAYVQVDNSKIVETSNIYSKNGYLMYLSINNMFPDQIKKYLKNEKKLDDGYYSYNDDRIKIKYAPNRAVFNMIFGEKYDKEILPGVTPKTSLEQIKEKYPDYTMGSIEKGYLGYRNSEFYFFFNGSEASIYGYKYSRNKNFEEYLEEYIEDGDLEKFSIRISSIMSYDKFEENLDIGELNVIYPSRGVEINIKDNNAKGIKLYSNYNFTDETRDLVKDGKISFSTNDLVEIYEVNRLNLE